MLLNFKDLHPQKQDAAVWYQLNEVINFLIQGGTIECGDDGEFQAKVDAVLLKADDLRTPWFAGEMLLEGLEQELRAIAKSHAQNALYHDGQEEIIALGDLIVLGSVS